LGVVDQATFRPRKGLNLPASLALIAFFLSETADAGKFLKEGAH